MKLFFVFAIVPVIALADTPVAPAYTIINLGTLGGTNSRAMAINNSGQVVGHATLVNEDQHATLFSGTGTGNVDLGTLGGNRSSASGINDLGQIVGHSYTSTYATYGVLYSGTGANNFNLGTLGGGLSVAYSINNSSQIVGYSYTTNNETFHGVLFSGTGANNTDLGTLGGTSGYAYAINNNSQIVGASGANINSSATQYSGTGTNNVNLGTLSASFSSAYGVNDAGQIVGTASVGGGNKHATLFSGTGSGNVDLGHLGGGSSEALAINGAGQIVGNSWANGDTSKVAFFYNGGVMYNLKTLAAASASAMGVTNISIDGMGDAINEWGQIAATGTTPQGYRAFLLNPVNPVTTTLGSTRNTKFVAGMDYSKFTTSGVGGSTTVSLLGGVAGSSGAGKYGLNRNVNVSITVADGSVYGDVVEVNGTQQDTFVLSLGYKEADFTALFGAEENATLVWWNGSEWVNAVEGNTGGVEQFVEGAWNSSYGLGTYGVDKTNNTVWAVINHNSEFAIIPETSTVFLGGMAALVLCFRRKRIM